MVLKNDDPNKAVITTKGILSGQQRISHVIYDGEGDWQFFPNEDINEADFAVVALEQILEIDDALLKLPDIDLGQELIRKGNSDLWKVLID
jgi:hypothetical protein